ncbi:hypothetical protein RRG08_034216 [Elysia crispata]|uniref:Uncharacterized protein n=1 Tax=Elysia crispata TaxID=231223 RepID=A0AAE1A0E4_9GAST|nr:hypothetical protein RRG08_034216 [Elysia crispata]
MLAFVLWLPTTGKLDRVIAILVYSNVERWVRDHTRLDDGRSLVKRKLNTLPESCDHFHDCRIRWLLILSCHMWQIG